MNTITMYLGDVRDRMADLPDGHADLLVTSPPFLALRSYLPADHPDKHREIGSEPTPAAFLDTLYGLSADWRRLVPEWGSICVELGDTMSGSGGAGGGYNADGLRDGQQKFSGSASRSGWHRNGAAAGERRGQRYRQDGYVADSSSPNGGPGWPLAKSMCLIPHLYTIGLAYGHNPLTGQTHPAGRWRVRNVVAWARPNPPVGSLGKRNVEKRTGDQKFRPATSFITIACTGTGRYFDLDAVRTDYKPQSGAAQMVASKMRNDPEYTGRGSGVNGKSYMDGAGAPPLDWHTDDLDGDWLWKLATAPYSGSHYAVYPLTLPRRLILAMCPERVCQTCGWPSERIVGAAEYTQRGKPAVMLDMRQGDRSHVPPDVRNWGTTTGGDTGSVVRQAPTLGWTDCGCSTDGTHWRPGRVLDPFGGSGTTAVAAALEHRDAVLIDIDARNVDLVHRRLTETVRVFDRIDLEDSVEWTVETVTDRELQAINNGQTSLFDPPAA